MSRLLLRTLTRKSVIGFGQYSDLTVQNLIDMLRHKELLQIYYNFRNIDFNEDLIQELKIDKVYRIDKKAKSEERFLKETPFYIRTCLKLIIEDNEEKMNRQKMAFVQKDAKHKKRNIRATAGMATIKSRLRARNQKK